MASSLNKVMLMGNITRDIELRHTASNMAVATVGLAVNHRWKTPEGARRCGDGAFPSTTQLRRLGFRARSAARSRPPKF